jgi:hypothetical protein
VEVGDPAAAASYLGETASPGPTEFERVTPLQTAIALLEARLAIREGDYVGAADHLRQVTVDRAVIFLGDNQLPHWTLVEAEEQLGHLGAAASLFEGLANGEHAGTGDVFNRFITHSFAHRRAALLYAQLGDRENATKHWRAFLDALTQPDPEYEPWVEEAQHELARLEG